MTIAAVTDGTTVWMGGDSSDEGYDKKPATIQANPKVIQIGDAVVGSDNARLIQLIQYQIKPSGPTEGQDPVEWMVASFIPSLDPLYKDNDVYSRKKILIGLGGKIYTIECDKNVMVSVFPYQAIQGYDADIATGALGALPDEPPEDRIGMALALAEEHGQTRAPFTVISTKD